MLIAFAGCWHADPIAAERAINFCAENNIETLVQTGDWLYNYGAGRRLIKKVERLIKTKGIKLNVLGIRGNHDDPAMYRKFNIQPSPFGQPLPRVSDHMWHAPDGTVLTFDGVRFAFLGGAWSVDRAARVENVSYWKDEVTELDKIEALYGEDFQVLVTHEPPAGIDYVRLVQPPAWWDIENAERHREPSGALIQVKNPRLVITGHMHLYQDRTFMYRNGKPFRSVTLDRGDYSVYEKEEASILSDFLAVVDTGKLP